MEKYGFVYIWFDRYRKMYYVGSHWGYEKDGYICSSNRMRDAHRRRPDDFKRRILSKVFSIRKDLLFMENKWLKLIKKEELDKKYYNHNNYIKGFEYSPHWNENEESKKTVSEKLKEKWRDPEYRAKCFPYLGGRAGSKHSEETRKRISEIQTGKKRGPHSEETKFKMSAAHTGRVFSEERRKQMSEYRKGRPTVPCSEEKKLKIGIANRKLSWDDVCSIRSRYLSGCPKNGSRGLAREFGVSQRAIQNIVRNQSYVKEGNI